MKIWIDADACPREVREIVYRASERLELPVCLVANSYMNFPDSPLISIIVVSKGFDAADDHIADEVSPEDIVITADVPLAARIVRGGPSPSIPAGRSTPKRTSARGFPSAT